MFPLLFGMKGLQMFARLLQILRRNQHAKLSEHVCLIVTGNHLGPRLEKHKDCTFPDTQLETLLNNTYT